MKNWLEDKVKLRSILKQGDLANTIYGGTSQTTVSVKKNVKQMEVFVSASGVHSSDFRVSISSDKLILTRYLNELHNGVGQEKLHVPVFLKSIKLPKSFERERVKAYYEDGLLRVIVPLKGKLGISEKRDSRKIE
jgi:HSP20 family protein